MSRYVIETVVEREPDGLRLDQIQSAARAALAQAGVEAQVTVTILLTDDQTLRQLNRQHMGYDEPTDVLSFQMDADVPGMHAYLGDIAISVDSAMRQAEKVGHSLEAELQTLTVHAVLHLLGYDHDDLERRAVMWRQQAAILRNLSGDIVIPSEHGRD